MVERREFPRVSLTAASLLHLQDTDCRGQLQNISMSGALIRIEDQMVMPAGCDYNLTVYIEGEDTPLQFVVEVVCSALSLVGIRFVSSDAASAARLGQLIESLTSGQDTLKSDLNTIRTHLDNYLR